MLILQNGLVIYRNFLKESLKQEIIQYIDTYWKSNQFFQAISPNNKPIGGLMINMGKYGWYSDYSSGYRYININPKTNKNWPKIPDTVIKIWNELTNYSKRPHCCLVNYYNKENPKLVMHKDSDEIDIKAPILSISLGDDCIFRYRINQKNNSPSKSVRLKSGDVLIMDKDSRLISHGIDRVIFNSSNLLEKTFLGYGRINLTLRVVY